jgi:ketosteroid isomerase-like protein
MLLSLALAPWGAVALAQNPPAQAPPSSPAQNTEVIQRLEEDYLRAEIEDDTAIAGSILAEDYVGLRADGSSTSKADVMARLNLHQRQHQPYQITAVNMRVHLYGDTACVTYTKVYKRPGNQAAVSESVLHVLLRRNGIWRVQLSTVLPSPRAEAPAP